MAGSCWASKVTWTLGVFFSIPREFNEWNTMIQVYENVHNLETKQDTLLKLGIQLLCTCSYVLKIKNENRFFFLSKRCHSPPFKAQLQTQPSTLQGDQSYRRIWSVGVQWQVCDENGLSARQWAADTLKLQVTRYYKTPGEPVGRDTTRTKVYSTMFSLLLMSSLWSRGSILFTHM